MRGHFQYLRFKTFSMTPRTPQCEVFWALMSNSKHSGVPKDSKSPTLGVLGFTPTLGQSGVATLGILPRGGGCTCPVARERIQRGREFSPHEGAACLFRVFLVPKASETSEASALGTVCPAPLLAVSERKTDSERKGEGIGGTWEKCLRSESSVVLLSACTISSSGTSNKSSR
jgi:hypothetical protein